MADDITTRYVRCSLEIRRGGTLRILSAALRFAPDGERTAQAVEALEAR